MPKNQKYTQLSHHATAAYATSSTLLHSKSASHASYSTTYPESIFRTFLPAKPHPPLQITYSYSISISSKEQQSKQ